MTTHSFDAPHFDPNLFDEYVASHGYGDPTQEGREVGARLYAEYRDYSEAAADVVAMGMTEDSEE